MGIPDTMATNGDTHTIHRDGVVESVRGNRIAVRVARASACGGCKVSDHCNASQCRNTVVYVYSSAASTYNIGDPVTLSGTTSMAFRSVLIGFGVPLLLLMVAAPLLLAVTGRESIAAVGALATLIPYYIILYFLKDKIGRTVVLQIARKNI